MSETIHVILVTPEKQFASMDANLVEVPGELGDFGVLPGHAPLISTIRPGIVTIYTPAKKEQFFVVGGVAEVTNDRCAILAEYLEQMDQLTIEQAKLALEQATAKQEAALGDDALRFAEREKMIAQLRLQALESVVKL